MRNNPIEHVKNLMARKNIRLVVTVQAEIEPEAPKKPKKKKASKE
jgi:hypothetical protein